MQANLLGRLALALDPVLFARQLGLEPDPWQAQLLRSRRSRILVNASRQSGKSTTVAIKALHRALYRPGSLILMVSPSLRQSSELFRKALEAYRFLDRPVDADAENKLSLELENESRMASLPGSEATIRGLSGADMVIVDEASRVDDELLVAVRPMLAVSNGCLIAPSTPNGPTGWWHKAYTTEPDWERFEIPATMCPRISPEFLAEERAALGATAFAREYMCSFEIGEGALWRQGWIDSHRVRYCPQLVRVAVAVDPATTSNAGSDETGVIVGGVAENGHAYILADKSMRGSPDEWARAIVANYHEYRGDRVVAEVNQGGEMVESLLRQVDPNVSYAAVRATRGKYVRAEPVSALYEQGKVHHVGTFPELEKQLVGWAPGDRSPDRLDALVWLLHYLVLDQGRVPLSGEDGDLDAINNHPEVVAATARLESIQQGLAERLGISREEVNRLWMN